MKKKFNLLFVVLCSFISLAACDKVGHRSSSDAGGMIAVVSREEGSGARDSFETLVDVNTGKDSEMTADAIIQNGNGVVATLVSDNAAAIGYISFATFIDRGADLVGISIDGVAPTTDNMLSGEYQFVRPFNFVYMPRDIGIVEEAFIAFAASIDGLEILADLGAVVDMADAETFDASAWDIPVGTVAFGGSTSTEATATALMEAFTATFPQIEITYEAVGSGAGIIGAKEGTFSLGFASRAIHDTELDAGLNFVTYCLDGIVIVVNSANGTNDLTAEQIRGIYLGEITDWSAVQ